MAIYYRIYPGDNKWKEHPACEQCNHAFTTDESIFPLVFNADHKRFLCFDCLERFINEHYPKHDDWDDEDDDDY